MNKVGISSASRAVWSRKTHNDMMASSVQDCFFYSLVFDPVQKTLLADQGEIRVGSKYQAEIPDKLAEGERHTAYISNPRCV